MGHFSVEITGFPGSLLSGNQHTIKPEHYPAVADALLPAIIDILGEAVDDVTIAAWGEAYWYLAEVLIARERELYTDSASVMSSIGETPAS